MELNDKRFKRNATLGVGAVWLAFMLYFSLVKSLHPMVLSPIFLAFGLSIVFINKPFPFSDKVKVLRLLDFVMIGVLVWVSVFYYMEQTRIITRILHLYPVQLEDNMITLYLLVFILDEVRSTIG